MNTLEKISPDRKTKRSSEVYSFLLEPKTSLFKMMVKVKRKKLKVR